MTPVHVGSTWADEWLLLHLSFSFINLIVNVMAFHPRLQLPKAEQKAQIPTSNLITQRSMPIIPGGVPKSRNLMFWAVISFRHKA